MAPPKYFLIAGGTGRQGGAVVEALLTKKISPNCIFVITRDVQGVGAARLAGRGINLVKGQLGQPGEIIEQLRAEGVPLHQTGVFLAQAHGPTELDDAKVFIDAVAAAAVARVVYSSVDRGGKEQSDRDASYCKTFSDKFLIEKYLIATSPNYTILRPTWFVDNAVWGFAGRLCMTGWREVMKGKRLQVTTTRDIGRWAVEALLRNDLHNTAVSIASDELTFDQADRVFREETGQPIGVTYGWLARLLIWAVTDLRTMFAWIAERDYGADLESLKNTLEPTTFRQWVRETVKDKKLD